MERSTIVNMELLISTNEPGCVCKSQLDIAVRDVDAS